MKIERRVSSRLFPFAWLLIGLGGWGEPAVAQRAPDNLVEAANFIYSLTQVVPQVENQGWGVPRAIQFDYDKDGDLDASDRVLLFLNGIPSFSASPLRDQIWVRHNPNTWNGYNNPYPAATAVKVLPQPGSGCVGCDVEGDTRIYGHPWPYVYDQRVFLLAFVAGDQGPSNADFNEVLLGASPNGATSWTFMRFLRLAENRSLPSISWQTVVVGGQTYHWGFADTPGGFVTIRFRHAGVAPTCANSPYCFSNTALEIYGKLPGSSIAEWLVVPTCQSVGDTSSGFKFCMFTNNSNTDGTAINPVVLSGAEVQRHPTLVYLSAFSPPSYELWYSADVTDEDCGCDNDGTSINFKNTFFYRSVTFPASASGLPTLGLAQQLRQDPTTGPVRCLPSSLNHYRKWPFRLGWTLDLFYSRTWDPPTNPFACITTPRPYGYVVRTRLRAN